MVGTRCQIHRHHSRNEFTALTEPNKRTLLKRLAVDLAALCSNPEDLDHAFDLLNATYTTEVAQAARDRLKNDPAISPLVSEHYWGGLACIASVDRDASRLIGPCLWPLHDLAGVE